MMRANEYLYGWKSTAPETVAPEVWQKMYDVYVKDEYHLGLKQFMEESNPAARQAMLGRLLEVDRQGTYKFNADERRQMVEEYAKNVAQNGLACTAKTCGNQLLKADIQQQVRVLAIEQHRPSLQKEFVREEVKVAKLPSNHQPISRKDKSERTNMAGAWKDPPSVCQPGRKGTMENRLVLDTMEAQCCSHNSLPSALDGYKVTYVKTVTVFDSTRRLIVL